MRALLLLGLLMPLQAHAACKAKAPEAFAPFFASFAEDKGFAVERTRYPLDVWRHEFDIEDKPLVVKNKTTREQDADLPSTGAFAKENGMAFTTTALKRSQATVRMAKPGTDWLLTYHFMRAGHCWYLQRIEDHSL